MDGGVCLQVGVHGFHLVVCDEAEIYFQMLYGCALGGGKSKEAVGLVEEGGPVGQRADSGIGGGGGRHVVLERERHALLPPYIRQVRSPHEASEKGPFSVSFLHRQAQAHDEESRQSPPAGHVISTSKDRPPAAGKGIVCA